MDDYAICFMFIGSAVIFLNIIVIYCIWTKFRREDNSQLVLLSSLSIADLLQGVDVICIASLSTLIRYKYKGKPLPHAITVMHGILVDFLSKYIFSVSVVTLMVLAVVKMLAVTRNQHFTKSTLRKISTAIWIVNCLLLSTEYGAFKYGVYQPAQIKYRLLWSTVLTFLTLCVFIGCFVKILVVVRRANSDLVDVPADGIPPYVSRTFDGNMSKIAVCQVIAFVVFNLPQQICYLISFFADINIRHHWMTVFIFLNPVFDSITFFIIYRHVWNLRRPETIVLQEEAIERKERSARQSSVACSVVSCQESRSSRHSDTLKQVEKADEVIPEVPGTEVNM